MADIRDTDDESVFQQNLEILVKEEDGVFEAEAGDGFSVQGVSAEGDAVVPGGGLVGGGGGGGFEEADGVFDGAGAAVGVEGVREGLDKVDGEEVDGVGDVAEGGGEFVWWGRVEVFGVGEVEAADGEGEAFAGDRFDGVDGVEVFADPATLVCDGRLADFVLGAEVWQLGSAVCHLLALSFTPLEVLLHEFSAAAEEVSALRLLLAGLFDLFFYSLLRVLDGFEAILGFGNLVTLDESGFVSL